jgi:hypothetical protein
MIGMTTEIFFLELSSETITRANNTSTLTQFTIKDVDLDKNLCVGLFYLSAYDSSIITASHRQGAKKQSPLPPPIVKEKFEEKSERDCA